jgi:PD-(D/E)XK nuclease superfamily protein
VTDLLTTPAPDPIKRDGWGRPLVVPPSGGKAVAYTRCTTYVSCLEDTFNLGKWMQRMVAIGITQRPDIHLQVASLAGNPDGNKRDLDKACDAAREAASASAAATTGTALHQLTELIDRGQDVGVIPEAYTADLKAYETATAHMKHLWIEQFCVQDPLKIGGTPDRIVEVDGKRYIADVKTGSIEFGIGKIAMQLAVYARSQVYDIDTAERSVHDAELDKGIIIHLPAGKGTCGLYWVDILAGWGGVKHAKDVRSWRAKKFTDLTEKYASGFPADPIEVAINVAASEQELLGLWTANHAAWTEAHTRLAAAKKAALQASTPAA